MRKATIQVEIECKLDEGHFATWNELTLEQQAVFDEAVPGCGDSGVLSHWCEGCPFCESFQEDVVDYEPQPQTEHH